MLQVAALALAIVYIQTFHQMELLTAPDFNVYHDSYARANFFLTARVEDKETTGPLETTPETDIPAWALREDSAGYEDMQSVFRQVSHLELLQQVYWLVQSANIFLLLLRLQRNMAFQVSVTRTPRASVRWTVRKGGGRACGQ
ncbi:hypothetical protein CYMTET_19772 [Cymbomonas tetramitiformis]|uniref:Uncharacterized protein n=1 Tax=Cymbomonas tetramitiformis TaxID=36881 RepID=A0AAE0G5E7_9CHLO|nr:hypothetical protein CYMTET_19772 [Cymbomonas tetramitiformis]